ncbi:hypothetical protein SAMN05880582_101197 [Rhizobium sp. RU20A]|uniref:hypothetical protein n=1 Tax=Rhizobium sp. RU20A TaxID=1907412 RepID=UPI000955A3EF|nr:hypothetical protein [Rhizobium sp. RU20A]SIP96633.1 hypothetical protein SAMN05880582_101197 [Rhizobium sp. RU20A]
MALTNAEIQKRWRERQKAKKAAALKVADENALSYREPFFERYQRSGGTIAEILDLANMEPPKIEDDSDPHSMTGWIEESYIDHPEDSPYFNQKGSIAQAEIAVGCMISAAAELAELINEHKRSEIDARIAEIEQSDLSDPAARNTAFAEMARLKRMRDQLSQQVRWTFPQWKVTGE